jgi:hypothetical protein
VTGDHECAHPDCHRTIRFGMFACRQHWFEVPTDLRRRLNDAWRRFQAGTGSVADVRDAQAAVLVSWD